MESGKNVCVAIRETPIDEQNPYSYKQRMHMFMAEFKSEILKRQMIVMPIPDIGEVCYGRKVGWGIREIKLSKEVEEISATKIRSSDGNTD